MAEELVCTQEEESGAVGAERVREIHHQVKNNLQLVNSLLRIQSRGVADPQTRAIFKRGEERIQSMALVYDTLYRGGPCSKVPVHEYLVEMVQQLVKGARNQNGLPHVSCELDPLYISSKPAMHLGLLINEVVSHRIRQVSSEGKPLSLLIRLFQRDGVIEFDLYDDGPALELSVGVTAVEYQILEALTRQLEGVVCYPTSSHFLMRITLPEEVLFRT